MQGEIFAFYALSVAKRKQTNHFCIKRACKVTGVMKLPMCMSPAVCF